jgi:hypothetical protein
MDISWIKTKEERKRIIHNYEIFISMHGGDIQKSNLSRFDMLRYLWLNDLYLDELFHFSLYCNLMLDSNTTIDTLYYDLVWLSQKVQNYYCHYYFHVDIIFPNMRSNIVLTYEPIQSNSCATEEDIKPITVDNNENMYDIMFDNK